jgi:hypothetical protein
MVGQNELGEGFLAAKDYVAAFLPHEDETHLLHRGDTFAAGNPR